MKRKRSAGGAAKARAAWPPRRPVCSAAASTAKSIWPRIPRQASSGRWSSRPAARAIARICRNSPASSRRAERSAAAIALSTPAGAMPRFRRGGTGVIPVRRSGPDCPAALARNTILPATRRLGRVRRTSVVPLAPRFRLTLETMVRLSCPRPDRGRDEGPQVVRRADRLEGSRPPNRRIMPHRVVQAARTRPGERRQSSPFFGSGSGCEAWNRHGVDDGRRENGAARTD